MSERSIWSAGPDADIVVKLRAQIPPSELGEKAAQAIIALRAERDTLALVVAEQRAALEGIRDSLGYERGDEVWQVADEALATPQPEAVERAAALLEAADRMARAMDALVLGDAEPVEAHAILAEYLSLRQGHGGEAQQP